jgi:hypothetical protein
MNNFLLNFYSCWHFLCGMVLKDFYARSLLVCFYVADNLELHLVSKVVLIEIHHFVLH